jgi:hypothetical protein
MLLLGMLTPQSSWSAETDITDAFARCFTTFQSQSEMARQDDALCREFTALAMLPEAPFTTTDAVSRELAGFVMIPGLPFCIADAASREFATFVMIPQLARVTDAVSRDFTFCTDPQYSGVDEKPQVLLQELTLSSPQPNPFRSVTEFRLGLPRESLVSAFIYDPAGRRMAGTVQPKRLPSGWHTLRIDASGWKSGVYFYDLRVGDLRKTGKFVLL